MRKNIPETEFLQLKDRGGLFKPSKSVIKVCEEAEKCIQRMMAVTNGKLPRCKGIPDTIAVSVLNDLGSSNVFAELNEHMFEFSFTEENHVFALIKRLVKCYCKVRFYHLGKEATLKETGPKIRKKLNKIILFKGQ